MTVEKLISELSKMPKDANAGFIYDGANRANVEFVYLSNKGDVCLSDYGESVMYDEDRPIGSPSVKEQRYFNMPENPTIDED